MSEKYKSIAEWLGGIPVEAAKEAADAIAMQYPTMELQMIPKLAWRYIATGKWPENNTWITDMNDRAIVVSLISHVLGMNGHQKSVMIEVARYMSRSNSDRAAERDASSFAELQPNSWTAPVPLVQLPELEPDPA